MFKLKRIYEACEPSDGYRVLVDRMWTRGVSMESVLSGTLRKWEHVTAMDEGILFTIRRQLLGKPPVSLCAWVPLSPDRQVQSFQFFPGQLNVPMGADLASICQ